jgi:hypothetical protein
MNDLEPAAKRPAARADADRTKATIKAVKDALLPSSRLVWGYDRISAFVENRVAARLRDVPPERIRPPRSPHVAAPALDGLRYVENETSLCDLHVNLLAAALDAETAVNAHPAFVEIIRSMAPDEAKVIMLFSSQEPQPVIDVQVQPADGGSVVVIRNLSLIGREAGCQRADLGSAHLDNLTRLGLVEIVPGAHLIDPARYATVERVHEIEKMKALAAGTNKTVTCEHKTARLTSFGRQFCLACVLDRPASSTGF